MAETNEERVKKFTQAIRDGDVLRLEALASDGFPLDWFEDGKQANPLTLAICHRKHNVLICLLKLGFDPCFQYENGVSAMHTAVYFRDHVAMHVLLEHKADVNATDRRGRTPLSEAALYLLTDQVRYLLKAKAFPNMMYDSGESIIVRAASQKRTDIIKLLLEGQAHVNQKSGRGFTALAIAAFSNFSNTVQLLFEHGADAEVEVPYFSSESVHFPKSKRLCDFTFDNKTIRHLFAAYGFVWRPDTHSHAATPLKRCVLTVTMIRSLEPSSPLFFIPNELLFHIFYFVRFLPLK